jgi:hypothetical protein
VDHQGLAKEALDGRDVDALQCDSRMHVNDVVVPSEQQRTQHLDRDECPLIVVLVIMLEMDPTSIGLEDLGLVS